MTYEVVFAFMPTRPSKFIVFMVYDVLPLSQQLFGKEKKKKLLLFICIVWLIFFNSKPQISNASNGCWNIDQKGFSCITKGPYLLHKV